MPEEPARDELSSALRELRASLQLSGTDAARQVGMSQASLSRYETGRQVPDPDTVAALCRLYDVPAEQRRHLEALAADLWRDANPRARAVRKAASNMQRRIGRIEQASARIGVFQPVVVPGLLQTNDYARAVFASGGVDDAADAVTERLARQELLADPAKHFTLIMSEGVPRWVLGSPAIMRDQIEQIIDLSRHDNIEVGVVGTRSIANVIPMSGFDVYDDRAAVVATNATTSFFTESADVQTFTELFARVRAAAVFGDPARELLRHAAADLPPS